MNRHSLLAVKAEQRRVRLDVTGAVQGVGFRPFEHRLAVSEGLGGFVRNTAAGVSLEVEGGVEALERFFGPGSTPRLSRRPKSMRGTYAWFRFKANRTL